MAKSTTTTKKSTTVPRVMGTKSGLNLQETWAQLFICNEQHAKMPNKRPLSDVGLLAAMRAEFPSKKDATTITRVTMLRGIYNKGTNMYKHVGPAGGKGRPISRRYDAKGTLVPPRRRVDANGILLEPSVAAPKADKKKAGKKVVKKATKKVVRKKVKLVK